MDTLSLTLRRSCLRRAVVPVFVPRRYHRLDVLTSSTGLCPPYPAVAE
jgi:hypothetical protein